MELMSLKPSNGTLPTTHEATIYLDDESPSIQEAAKKLGDADAHEYLLALHELKGCPRTVSA